MSSSWIESELFKQKTFDMTNHGYLSNFNVLKYFGSFSFHDIYQLSSVSWSYGETNIQTLQKTFNVKHQKKVWKGLYHQISLMSHSMHTSDKWSILSLDLNCNSRFQALDGMDPSTPKQMSLEASFSFFKPLCVIKKFMINKVRLSTSNLESTSFTFNNKGIKHQCCTM